MLGAGNQRSLDRLAHRGQLPGGVQNFQQRNQVAANQFWFGQVQVPEAGAAEAILALRRVDHEHQGLIGRLFENQLVLG